MSRQFRLFLLPSDAEALTEDLRDRVGLKLIDAKSPRPEPIEIPSPVQEYSSHWSGKKTFGANCYLAAVTADHVKMRYIANQGYWLVDQELSDVIEFDGGEYDGEILVAGRFYFQTDFLLKDDVWPKREEFLKWADRIFRRAKTRLIYSKGLDAYIGPDARDWRSSGGRFAWMRTPGREPVWAAERG